MKSCLFVCGVLLAVALCEAFPQKDGQVFSSEAIRQAQNTFLIPKDAQIQKVCPYSILKTQQDLSILD